MEKKELTQKDEIKKDIGKQAALEAMKNSEGGMMVISSLKKDIMNSIDEISTKYLEDSHPELIAVCAKLSERLVLYRILSGAEKRKKIAIKDLNELLADDPDEE
jgi:hypothetical protein